MNCNDDESHNSQVKSSRPPEKGNNPAEYGLDYQKRNSVSVDDKVVLKPKEEEKPIVVKNPVHEWLNMALNHWSSTLVFSTLTIYVLFADDLKMLCSDKVKSYFN